GKIKQDQKAVILLDAYPDEKINASVEHIYYESKTVNNVTIYEVDLKPDNVPSFFRSGMNTAINFIQNSKDGVLLLPLEAVHKEKDESYVLLQKNGNISPVKQIVRLGLSDDKNVEVLSGVDEKDKVIVKSKKFSIPKSDAGTNPFMPQRKKKEVTGK
ncbi:MAG: efflux RND transporter periplasmic adaptor subunit, partial [Candidatus Omnitrophica bacterium]|nr:efflux RND transporter periplasmic adaptor subunit [Candidatus Omnitrophota bacterium]